MTSGRIGVTIFRSTIRAVDDYVHDYSAEKPKTISTNSDSGGRYFTVFISICRGIVRPAFTPDLDSRSLATFTA